MEGSVRGRDFQKLNTQGCCFLCLGSNKINLEESHETDDTERELIRKKTSMRCLTRYLQVNLDGMEQATTSAALSKTGSKPEIEVEVDLCESCEKLASRFSSLFQQLEKVQMELEFSFGEINRIVALSSQTLELVRNYSRKMTSQLESLSQLVLVDKLRNEIREKGLKTRRPPLVLLKRVNKLPKQEVPDSAEEMDSADFADFEGSAWSSMRRSNVTESNNDCSLTPEVKAETEDSSVILPKKDVEQSKKEKGHRSNNFSKYSVTENCVAQEPTNDCDWRSVPEIQREPENSFVISPKKIVKQFIKKENHRSKVPTFSKNLVTGKYDCTLCQKPFNSFNTVRTHCNEFHLRAYKSVKKEFKCISCKKCFANLASLKIHRRQSGKCGIRAYVRPSQFRKAIKIESESEGGAVDDPGEIILPDLPSSPPTPNSTEGHQEDLNLANNEKLSQTIEPPVKQIAKKGECYTRNHSTGMYECNKCDKTSKSAKTIEDHFNSAHLQIKFKCDICHIAVYNFLSTLNKHKKTCQEKLEIKLAKEKDPRFRFVCKICGKRFDKDQKLHDHTKGVHKNHKRYQCDLCDKKYNEKRTLKKHQAAIHQA